MYAPTDDDLVTTYTPSNPHLKVLIEDMGRMICRTSNCPNDGQQAGDPCGHRRMASQFVKATADHYITVLEKAGDSSASEILRDEV